MIKETKSDAKPAEAKPGFLKSLGSFLFAVALLLAFRWLLFEPYVIPSGSMIPSLLIHDHVLVNKFAFGIRLPFSKTWIAKFGLPKRGDVVVFRSVESDDYFMIKRVVGLPGDRIEYKADGTLWINGEAIPHEYMGDTPEQVNVPPFYRLKDVDLSRGVFGDFQFFKEKLGDHTYRSILKKDSFRWAEEPFVVPADHLFMMGDNRDDSRDGRVWGPLPVDHLMGKALLIWLSCEDTLPVASFLCDPLTLRWKRFFHIID